jgi:molybdopterin molybdotransferase
MPTAVAVLEGKTVLILSGNPVASVIGFEVFGRAMVCRLQGMGRTEPRSMVKATLKRKVVSALGRKTYVRVLVTLKGDELFAEPMSAKGSGSISTMTQSNGFMVVPENREGINEGESVFVHLFSAVEVSS